MVSPDDFKNRFNDFASELVSDHALKIRKDFIGMSAWVLKDRLRLQQEAKATTHIDEALDFWLKSTTQPVVAEGITPSPTMSFIVEGPPQANGVPRMKVHVPVPEGFRSDESSHIETLPLPLVIFPEQLLKQGTTTRVLGRYAVTNAECRIYPVEGAVAETGPELWVPQATRQRVATHLPELTQMVESLVYWNLIPQSRVIVGHGDVIDL